MKKDALVCTLALSILAFQSCTDAGKEAVAEAYQLNFVPAKTNNELKLLTSNKDANIVRSIEQLDNLVSRRLTPLSKLSTSDYSEFKKGLVKGEGAFGSINLTILKSRLSITDYEKVMAMFGLDTKNGFWENANSSTLLGSGGRENVIPEKGKEDYKYYECDGKHNCNRVTRDVICTSNC